MFFVSLVHEHKGMVKVGSGIQGRNQVQLMHILTS